MSSKISCYKGYYKGYLIKSSYEYIFCKILEKNNIVYKYEEKTYDLKDCSYTPDFFIYNDKNILTSIIEIKSGNKQKIEESIKRK